MSQNIVTRADRRGSTTTAGRSGPAATDHSTTRPRIIQGKEQAMARSVARNCLTDACNQALFELLSGLGSADSPEKVRIGLLASEMLRQEVDATRSRLSRGGNLEASMFD